MKTMRRRREEIEKSIIIRIYIEYEGLVVAVVVVVVIILFNIVFLQ